MEQVGSDLFVPCHPCPSVENVDGRSQKTLAGNPRLTTPVHKGLTRGKSPATPKGCCARPLMKLCPGPSPVLRGLDTSFLSPLRPLASDPGTPHAREASARERPVPSPTWCWRPPPPRPRSACRCWPALALLPRLGGDVEPVWFPEARACLRPPECPPKGARASLGSLQTLQDALTPTLLSSHSFTCPRSSA